MSKSLNQLLILFLVVILLYVLKPILMPLIFSIILAAIVFPILDFLERKLHFGHAFTALIGVLLVSGVTVALVMLITSELTSFASQSDLYMAKFHELFDSFVVYLDTNTQMDVAPLQGLETPSLSAIWENSGDTITNVFSLTSQLIGDLVMVPLYIFFILYYRSFLIEFVYRAFQSVSQERMEKILKGLYDVVQNYLRGLLMVMLIVGVLNSIGLLLLGIDNAVFFGFLGALLLLIPYIGIIIGSLLPALVALATKDSYWYSVGVIGIFVFVQFLEGNFITPKITGSKMSMNALISIISLFVFGMLWGMAGLVLALPLTAMLKVIFDHSETMQAWGFLIGETEVHHTAKHNMVWMKLRVKYLNKRKN
jgi:predicted PurR-regulated permease PerM